MFPVLSPTQAWSYDGWNELCHLQAKVARGRCAYSVFLSLSTSLIERTENLDEGWGKLHAWKVTPVRTLTLTILTRTLTLHWDLSVLEVCSTLTNTYLYINPPSPVYFRYHINMGPKKCSFKITVNNANRSKIYI